MKLFVVEVHGSGGLAHYTYQLCSALQEQPQVELTLVTTTDYELEQFPRNFVLEKRMQLWKHFQSSRSAGSSNPLVRLGRKLFWTMRRGVRAMRLVYAWHSMTNYLISQRPDVIQFGKINFPFEAFFLARLRRHGFVLTQVCHEFELREQENLTVALLANRLYASVYDNFSVIFFHSEQNRKRFLSLFPVPAEYTHIIPHGNESMFLKVAGEMAPDVDLLQRYELRPDEPVVLFFGTLTPSKGLPELLRAFALVREQTHARLIIAGFPLKHVTMQEFTDLAEELGISDAVTFDARYIPFGEVGPLMELAQMVVYPYRNATQSGALQVAYAFGRPVIATKVGGLPEAVEDGASGLLVPAEAPEELAQAILSLLNDPQRAAEMGAYARHLSETRYSWTPIAEKIVGIYQDVLRNRTLEA